MIKRKDKGKITEEKLAAAKKNKKKWWRLWPYDCDIIYILLFCLLFYMHVLKMLNYYIFTFLILLNFQPGKIWSKS